MSAGKRGRQNPAGAVDAQLSEETEIPGPPGPVEAPAEAQRERPALRERLRERAHTGLERARDLVSQPEVRRVGISAGAAVVGGILSQNLLGALATGGVVYLGLRYLDARRERQEIEVEPHTSDVAPAAS